MTEGSRTRLPNRRLQATADIEWMGKRWTVSVGFEPSGRAAEVFVKGTQVGSSLEAIFDDAAVLLSLLMQGGWGAAALAGHLGREGIDPFAKAASPIALVAETVAALEADLAAGVAGFHRRLGGGP